MPNSHLQSLARLGQSIWLDDICREYLEDGTLARLIIDDEVSGVTSNPAIFERAIAESRYYDAIIDERARSGDGVADIYERLVIEDIQHAADVLRETYELSNGVDGFVSLEVSPHLAHNTAETVIEARRLWRAIDRTNAMIKIPATKAGPPAIRQLIFAGLNVNVTLLFGVARYRAVIEAYWQGLEDRLVLDLEIEQIASVASFFVSRIDSLVDEKLDETPTPAGIGLHRKAAVASAKLARRAFNASLEQSCWHSLVGHRAMKQRLLWASTGTKNPAFSDVKYIEALIGRDTVTTVPMATLNAYRDHGAPRPQLDEALDAAEAVRFNRDRP